MRIAFIDTMGLPFNGNTLNERGLGGSEAATIHIAKALQDLGHKVIVFCNTDIVAKYEEVYYVPLSKVADHKFIDVVISLRSVLPFMEQSFEFADLMRAAKYKILWRHDVYGIDDKEVKSLLESGHLHEVFNLSDWHTAIFKTTTGINDKYIWQTRNGYHHYKVEVEKDPNKFVFNAAVYKGLPLLLDTIWPKVKLHIPEATLTVIGGYYVGIEDGNKTYIDNCSNSSDVTFTGVIRPYKVAEEVASSTYMIYPPTSPETFGISTLEAIAYKTIPITYNLGALETVALDEASYKCGLNPAEYPDAFVATVVEAYKDDLTPKLKACEQVWDTCTWEVIAHEWSEHFRVALQEEIIYPTRNKRILIAVPSAVRIEVETFKSIYELIIPEGYEADFEFFWCYLIDQGRNYIAKHAIDHKYDYTLCVDSDIELPKDTLVKLLSHDKDLVCGMYRMRRPEQKIEIYTKDYYHTSWKDLKSGNLIEIGGCGFGCVLVKTSLFKGVGYPQFVYEQAEEFGNSFSEDNYFCRKAIEEGYKLYCDTSVRCKHKGTVMWEIEL